MKTHKSISRIWKATCGIMLLALIPAIHSYADTIVLVKDKTSNQCSQYVKFTCPSNSYAGMTGGGTNLFTGSGTTGQVTSAAGDSGKFLRADGTWQVTGTGDVSKAYVDQQDSIDSNRISFLEARSNVWNQAYDWVFGNSVSVALLYANSNNWNTAYSWGNHASGGYLKANGSVTWTGNQDAGGTILTNLGGFWMGSVLVTNMDTNVVTDLETSVSSLSNRVVVVEGGTNNWNTAFGWGNHASAGYFNNANQTNIVICKEISLQDPTNGLAYWMPNPFGSRSCTLVEAYAKAHGMTGTVDVITQHRTAAWYSYSTAQAGVTAAATGTAQSLTTAVTNGMRVGILPGALSAFAATNMLSVDFKFTCP